VLCLGAGESVEVTGAGEGPLRRLHRCRKRLLREVGGVGVHATRPSCDDRMFAARM
jgi:hypothetical protein